MRAWWLDYMLLKPCDGHFGYFLNMSCLIMGSWNIFVTKSILSLRHSFIWQILTGNMPCTRHCDRSREGVHGKWQQRVLIALADYGGIRRLVETFPHWSGVSLQWSKYLQAILWAQGPLTSKQPLQVCCGNHCRGRGELVVGERGGRKSWIK